jgi:hypothetical protein
MQGRGQFVDHQFAGLFINRTDIGVGAANVNTDSDRSFFHKILLSETVAFISILKIYYGSNIPLISHKV